MYDNSENKVSGHIRWLKHNLMASVAVNMAFQKVYFSRFFGGFIKNDKR